MPRSLAILLSLLLMGGLAAEEITREAEDYDRCQERLLPPEVFTRPTAS